MSNSNFPAFILFLTDQISLCAFLLFSKIYSAYMISSGVVILIFARSPLQRKTLSPIASTTEAIDVTDDTSFDWHSFADTHIDRQLYRNTAKIDVWDQLRWKWAELVDYCWYTRLPYERKHSKFER